LKLGETTVSALSLPASLAPAPTAHRRIGRYDVIREIASGGMATVLAARSTHPPAPSLAPPAPPPPALPALSAMSLAPTAPAAPEHALHRRWPRPAPPSASSPPRAPARFALAPNPYAPPVGRKANAPAAPR